MKKVKKIFAAAVVVACLSLVGAGSLAYFTADETAHNVITSGNVDIELQELRQNEDGTFEQFEDVVGVMPGVSVSKIVQVKNTGFGDAYVRIAIDSSIKLADGTFASAEDLEKYLHLDFNTEAWNLVDDWWYYVANDSFGHPGILSPTLTTEPLFENVTFDASMPNEYMNSEATITVYVQAVQSAHNPDDPTLGPLAAAGWPVSADVADAE